MAISGKQKLKESMVEVLASAGAPLRPRAVQVLVSNLVGHQIPDADFATVLDELLGEGRVKRSRGGPGGVLSLNPAAADPSEEQVTSPDPPARSGARGWALEKNLMAPIEAYLRSVYLPSESGLPKSAKTWLRDTSIGGPTGAGPWSRPDFTLAAVNNYRFVSPSQLDVFGFEVKTESGCDVRSVHEAYAHARFVNYAYLIWHLPEGSPKRTRLQTIRVGLIVFSDPEALGSYQALIDPTRKAPSPEAMEAFLEHRFSPADCGEIEAALRRR
jgi:hypothetical protein